MPTKKKNDTQGTQQDRNFARWQSQNRQIDNQLRFTTETGRCPICQDKPVGHGVTCGDVACIRGWLKISNSHEKQANPAPAQPPAKQSWTAVYHDMLRGIDDALHLPALLARCRKHLARGQMAISHNDELLLVRLHQDRTKLHSVMPSEATASRAWLQERGHA